MFFFFLGGGGINQVNLSEVSELKFGYTLPNPCLGAWPMFVLLEIGSRCQKRCQIFQLVLSLLVAKSQASVAQVQGTISECWVCFYMIYV